MTALSNFFAQSLPLLHQANSTNGDVTVVIVNDNARGLTKESAVSERRRHYEARVLRGWPASPYDAVPTSPSKASRWESELSATSKTSISNSPPAPQRRQSAAVSSIPTIPESLVAPQIPRRRVSVKHEEEEKKECTSSFARHERSHQGSSSSDGISSSDYALAPPRRRTSCLAWLDEVEANERLSSNDREGQIPETKLQPRSTTTGKSSSTITAIPTDLLLRMDSQLSKISSSLSKKGTSGTSTPKNKARNSKAAPRRPRRMKSMDLDDDDDDDETSCCDGSAPLTKSPQPQDYDILTVSTQATTDDENDNSIRSTMSHSIHSVIVNKHTTTSATTNNDPVEQSPTTKLSSSEQPLVLEDAAKHVVVGAPTRRSSSSRRDSDFSSSSRGGGASATTKRKVSPTKNRQKRRESPDQRMVGKKPLESY